MPLSKKKLSYPQYRVIEALRKEGTVLIESCYYHWSHVVQGKKVLINSVYLPTVTFLKKNNMIIKVEGEKDRYILNPEWTFVNSKK